MHLDESDSEDDEVLKNARNTTELLRHDNGVFENAGVGGAGGEEEDSGSVSWIGRVGRFGELFGRMNNRDRNLSARDWRRGRYADVNATARPRRRGRRRASEEDEHEDMELVFELEEGDGRMSSRESSFGHSEKNEIYMGTSASGSFVSMTVRFYF